MMHGMIRIAISVNILLVLSACSSEAVTRNGYQAAESIRQQQCLRQPSSDCPPPGSYNKYEVQREEALKK